MDHEGGSKIGNQVSVEDSKPWFVPSFVKLLRGEPRSSCDVPHSILTSTALGSSKLRDMLTEVTSVLKTNMRCKLQFERLDAILCNIGSTIAARHYIE